MKHKTPDINDWKFQLGQVEKVLKEVKKDKININNEMIELKVREIQGENVGTEISACKKKLLENRMGELALEAQMEKLRISIQNF